MGVEFNENKPLGYGYQQKTNTGGVTNFFIKLGLAKDEKGANVVMIIVTIVCASLAIYIAL